MVCERSAPRRAERRRGAAQGVGERIAARPVPKLLLLNGSHDRETSACAGRAGAMGAADVVAAVVDALNRRHGRRGRALGHAPAAYVTAVLAPAGGALDADAAVLAALGIRCARRAPRRPAQRSPRLRCRGRAKHLSASRPLTHALPVYLSWLFMRVRPRGLHRPPPR